MSKLGELQGIEKVEQTYLFFQYNTYYLEDGQWFDALEDNELVKYEPLIAELNMIYIRSI